MESYVDGRKARFAKLYQIARENFQAKKAATTKILPELELDTDGFPKLKIKLGVHIPSDLTYAEDVMLRAKVYARLKICPRCGVPNVAKHKHCFWCDQPMHDHDHDHDHDHNYK